MIKKQKLKIKILTLKFVSRRYYEWMNDIEITKYTSQYREKQTFYKIKKFVKLMLESKNEFLYGIFIVDNNKEIHIGNIKLGPINRKNLTADISYIIGDKKYWGMGYASEAVKKVIRLAKKKFKLRKLQAGHQKKNIASKKVLLKNNFKLEGIFKSQIKIGKFERTDRYVYGLIL